MPYLNIDDGMDEHPKVERLSDAAFRMLWRDMFAWSRSGAVRPGLVGQLVKDKMLRRAPRGWLPEGIRPKLRYRAKISQPVRRLVFERDGYRCVTCGTSDDLTLDHIVPWSLGGSDTPDNLQTLCRVCNSRKGTRH